MDRHRSSPSSAWRCIAGEPRLGDAWPGRSDLTLLVGGAFTWAIGQVMIRQLGEVGGFTMIAWVAVFAAPQLFVFSLIARAATR